MNDADYEKQKVRVLERFTRWKDDMGLAGWHLDIAWYRECANTDAQGSGDTAMEVSSQWQYRQALFSVYLPKVALEDDDRLDWMVCHEILHVLVAEMRGDRKVNKHEERVCSQLAQSFIWVRTCAEERGRGCVVAGTTEPTVWRDAPNTASWPR